MRIVIATAIRGDDIRLDQSFFNNFLADHAASSLLRVVVTTCHRPPHPDWNRLVDWSFYSRPVRVEVATLETTIVARDQRFRVDTISSSGAVTVDTVVVDDVMMILLVVVAVRVPPNHSNRSTAGRWSGAHSDNREKRDNEPTRWAFDPKLVDSVPSI